MAEPRPSPFLVAMRESERNALRQVTVRRELAAGKVVFHEGDPGDAMYVIERGSVAARRTRFDGKVATVRVIGPGEIFGELAIVGAPAPRTATMVTLQPTELLVIHRAGLDDLRARHPAVDRVLVEALAAEVRRLAGDLTEVLCEPAEVRVINRLLDLSVIYGGEDGTVIPVTQADLASMTGTTRGTVNRVLAGAAADDSVALQRGRIVIRSVDGLRRSLGS